MGQHRHTHSHKYTVNSEPSPVYFPVIGSASVSLKGSEPQGSTLGHRLPCAPSWGWDLLATAPGLYSEASWDALSLHQAALPQCVFEPVSSSWGDLDAVPRIGFTAPVPINNSRGEVWRERGRLEPESTRCQERAMGRIWSLRFS